MLSEGVVVNAVEEAPEAALGRRDRLVQLLEHAQLTLLNVLHWVAGWSVISENLLGLFLVSLIFGSIE